MKSAINDITMAWDDVGGGKALILIHGFPLDRSMWQPQIKELVDAGFRVITPDLRGFGESEAPQGPYSMGLFADDIVTLMDHLGIDSAVIGGMSMGGYVLLDILERYPSRVSAAALVVTRSVADDETARERRISLAREALESGARVVADAFVRVLFADTTAESNPDLVRGVYERMLRCSPVGLAGALMAMRNRKDYTPLLFSFNLPVVVIGADKDKAVPREHLRIMEAGLPRCISSLIAGGGHLVNMELPKEFNRTLLDFLASLKSS